MENNQENENYNPPDSETQNNHFSNLNIKIPPKDDFNKNNNLEDIRQKKEKIYIKIFIAIIYFALCITMEQVYRESLFDKSIEEQEDIRKDHDKESSFYKFWKFISNFGEAKITFIIFELIFLFFPISSSFLSLQILIYSSYLTNLFKIIYRNGRPYWESKKLDIICNSGYGNPSGHSLTSTAFYLSLFHIVTNFEFFRKKIIGKILRVIIFCLLFLLAGLVITSRVILAAHSINQVIYGFTLGLGIYFFAIYILSYHTYDPTKFIKHIIDFTVVLIYMSFHIAIFILLIILYFTLDDNRKIKYNIELNIFNGIRCKIKKKYLRLKYDAFFQALSITAVLGAHIGIILLIYVLKKNKYIIDGNITEFNRSSIKRWLKRLPILIISAIFIILYYVISGNSSLAIIFLFKSAISFFLTAFGIYFVGIFICIHCNLANENIKKEV